MDRSYSVSPAGAGLAGGLAGAGLGYTLAPRKYSLEQLLTQKPDVFEKTFSKELLNKAGRHQQNAYNTIVDGRKILEDALKNNTLVAKLTDVLGGSKYSNAYKAVKYFLPKARYQTAVVLGVIGALCGIAGSMFFGDNQV